MEAAPETSHQNPGNHSYDGDSPEVRYSKVVAGLAGLLAILLLSYYLRAPTVSAGLPYFYNEDEAHHFNRVVEMVQRGDFNPHYFHKPSLHFYLRMPVVAASFLWTVKNGQIRSIQDIRTRDAHGLSGYSLTASHPGIVKWNRMLSVLFALGTVALSAAIVFVLTRSILWSLASALLAGLSPGLIEYGAVIGVDMPATFFCTATILLALIHRRSGGFIPLLLSCLTAGFAVSTKYNALPIAAVPLIAALAAIRPTPSRVLTALIAPAVFFFLASPFILVSLPLFLDHFAYEIWHYGHAAHAGHAAEPGMEQAGFYAGWLFSDALGFIGMTLCAGGMLVLLEKRRESVLLLAFPVLYFTLMSMQRTHFERNMLMLLGVLPAFAGYALYRIEKLFTAPLYRFLIPALLVIAASVPLLSISLAARGAALGHSDSRTAAHRWLEQHNEPFVDTAIAGELQLPLFQSTRRGITALTLPGVERRSEQELALPELFQQGFARFVVGPEFELPPEFARFVTLEHDIVGADTLERIPNNPAIQIFRFSEMTTESLPAILDRLQPVPELTPDCPGEEGHCWISQRFSQIPASFPRTLEVFSPWREQRITLFDSKKNLVQEIHVPREDTLITLPDVAGPLYLFVPEIHVPAQHSESSDTRRLGIRYLVKQ